MKRFSLRLSEDAHADLKALASRNRRSIHSQILRFIDAGLAPRVGDDEQEDGTLGRERSRGQEEDQWISPM